MLHKIITNRIDVSFWMGKCTLYILRNWNFISTIGCAANWIGDPMRKFWLSSLQVFLCLLIGSWWDIFHLNGFAKCLTRFQNRKDILFIERLYEGICVSPDSVQSLKSFYEFLGIFSSSKIIKSFRFFDCYVHAREIYSNDFDLDLHYSIRRTKFT